MVHMRRVEYALNPVSGERVALAFTLRRHDKSCVVIVPNVQGTCYFDSDAATSHIASIRTRLATVQTAIQTEWLVRNSGPSVMLSDEVETPCATLEEAKEYVLTH